MNIIDTVKFFSISMGIFIFTSGAVVTFRIFPTKVASKSAFLVLRRVNDRDFNGWALEHPGTPAAAEH